MKKFWIIILVVAILAFGSISLALTQIIGDDFHLFSNLAGSEGVAVNVMIGVKNLPRGNNYEQSDLDGQVQADTIFELQKHGIKVFTLQEAEEIKGNPRLIIYAQLLADAKRQDFFHFAFTVKHFETAILSRNSKTTSGLCWNSTMNIEHGDMDFIRKSINDVVRKKYITEYLAANPKEPPVLENCEK